MEWRSGGSNGADCILRLERCVFECRALGARGCTRNPMSEQVHGSQDTEQGKYVYCIIKTDLARDFGAVGIGGRGDRVHTVHHREFAAVVSNCPLIVFDPTRENALAHEHVNELVMKDFTVLPMSFGTVFRTENDIKAFLKCTYEALSDVLQA